MRILQARTNVDVSLDFPLEVCGFISGKSIDQPLLCSGDYKKPYGNVRNGNDSCLPTNLTSFCANQCLLPAGCSSSTGKCECPSPTQLSDSIYATQQTCRCPGHPLVYYDGSNCTDATSKNISAMFNPIHHLTISSSWSNFTGIMVPTAHDTSEYVSDCAFYQKQY